jgi:16S rRNA processing protein RimM
MQLVVGRVTRPHGVRGEVSVEVRTDDPDLRFAVGRVMATDPAAAGPLTVESVRWHSGRLLIRFAGIADRDQAEELRGTWLTLESTEVESTGDPDEFHDHELIGLAVVTTSGEPVGRVTDVRHFGQDLLVIKPVPARSSAGPGAGPAEAGPADTGRVPTGPARAGHGPGGPALAARGRPGDGLHSELLVPFVAAIVPEVDVAAGRLVIDPPPGLLELGTGEPGPGRASPAAATPAGTSTAGPGPAGPGPAGPGPAGTGTAGS